MNQLQLEQVMRFEAAWDGRLGGPETRGLREVIAYCTARLMGVAGAELEDVLQYQREVAQLGLMLAHSNGGVPS